MAILREQVKSNSGQSVNSVTVTFDFATKAHSTILVVYRCFYASAAYTSITDNYSSAFNSPADVTKSDYAGTLQIASAYDIPGSGGSTNHSVTVNKAGQYFIVTIIEVSGLALTGALDKTATNGPSTYTSGSTASVTAGAQYMLGAHGKSPGAAPGNTSVQDAGWSLVDYKTDGSFHYLLTTQRIEAAASGTYASSGTVQSFDDNVIATYLGATGGGGGATPLRRNSSLSGLGASGPFFHDPLSSKGFARRDRIYVPARMAA